MCWRSVSVDYIIHLAYAYVNTMSLHRLHKSRAALLARAASVTAACATTPRRSASTYASRR